MDRIMRDTAVILLLIFGSISSQAAGGIFNRGAFWQKIDWIPPVCSISTSLSGWRPNASELLTFSCTDNRAIKSIQCRINGAAWGGCTTSATHSATSLTTGSTYTFEVRATDELDNVSNVPSRTWSVDLTAPTITSVTPSGTNTGSPSFSFAGSDTMSGIAGYECSYDTGSPSYSACTSPRATSGLTGAGTTYYFRVRATDNVGRVSTTSTTSWRNGNWSGWGSCNASCGGGTRYRTCTNPSPTSSPPGVTCAGSNSQSCNTHSCCTNANNSNNMCSGRYHTANSYSCGKSTCYQCLNPGTRCYSNSSYLSGTTCYCN